MMKNLLFMLLITGVLYSCANSMAEQTPVEKPSLPVISLQSSTAVTINQYPASIQGTVDVEIRPQVSGNLEEIYVDEGAYVTQGQALFNINQQPYLENLNNALANLHATEADLINARLEVEKFTPLVKNKIVSDYQLKTAKAAEKVAIANVKQAKAMVASAEINLGYTTITAPVSGYIGRLPKKQGSLLNPSDVQPLTTLSDVHEVHVYFSLSEIEFIQFKNRYAGKTIEEKVKHIPSVNLVLADKRTYAQPGKIDMVDGQFDKNTGAITLRATFPNPQGLLRSGNTGKIALEMTHKNTLTVPQEATLEVQDKVFVYAVNKDNVVSKQPIRVIGKSGTDYLVESGVKSGDRIVYKGFEYLQEGTVIAPETFKKGQELAKIN